MLTLIISKIVGLQDVTSNLLEFKSIKNKSFSWKIPGFPVMEIEFTEATCIWNGQRKTILLKKKHNIKRHDKVTCTSCCTISVNGVNREVIWKWQHDDKNDQNAEQQRQEEEDKDEETDHEEEEDDEGDDDVEEEELILHTVPFKVMGVTYSVEAQRHLEKVYTKWTEMKDKVQTKVEPEPSNNFDANAIVVLFKYEQNWVKLGYIAAELTKYVHLALQNGSLTAVAIKHIKFCTTYMKVGFYMTLELTKKGEWDSVVCKASKKVR
jgi:hypothetical protein